RLCGGTECTGGVLTYARTVAERTATAERVSGIQQDAANFWSKANEVAALDTAGDYVGAVKLALDDQAIAARALDDSIVAESASAQARFADAAHDARSGFAILAIALVVGLL